MKTESSVVICAATPHTTGNKPSLPSPPVRHWAAAAVAFGCCCCCCCRCLLLPAAACLLLAACCSQHCKLIRVYKCNIQ